MYYMYFASDSSMMARDDVISMLRYYLNTDEYKGWNFDEITGGETEFVDHEQYNNMKSIFQKLKK